MAVALRGPDFFIVGAPRCGTTAMTHYLGRHPEIGMCAWKETHHFAGEEMWRRIGRFRGDRNLTRAQYLNQFAAAQGARRLGEASVWYLYSSSAARAIQEFCPSADIIVMLRNPFEMVPSLHSHLVYLGIEPVADLERALALDEARERLGPPPGFPPDSYRASVQYAEQVRRYLGVFGPDRVHVIIYEQLRDDTLATYRSTCEFLGVDPNHAVDGTVVNPNKEVRSKALRRLLHRPPVPLQRFGRMLTSENLRRRTGTALQRWNTKLVPREPLPEKARRHLEPLVVREAAELEAVLGVDLSSWLDQVQR